MKKILLVDDLRNQLEIYANILREWGYEVAEAMGGEMAIEMVKKDFFDLIITDLEMPGLDGFRVAVLVKKHFSPLSKIIIWTGSPVSPEYIEATRAICDCFMSKDVLRLRNKVTEFLQD